jgi:hypothetical protein
MGRPRHACAAVFAGLVLLSVALCFADDLPDCNAYPVFLSVTPAQPGCADTVTLGATQSLTDSCWTAEAPFFFDAPPDFHFELASIDEWEPPIGCTHILIQIPFTRQVGPLAAGPYSLGVTHTSTSPRFGESACSDRISFEVTCCAELPSEVVSLQASVTAAGSEIWLNWSDVAGADDYVVFGQDEPDGPLTWPIQTASSGVVGTWVPLATAPSFFVVGARNSCGVGPRH